jgi:hypothetical protein
MKKENINTVYSAPVCCLVDLKSEGVLCESLNGGNEGYDNWNNYENDGWN